MIGRAPRPCAAARALALCLVAACLGAGCRGAAGPARQEVVVFAAASLTDALEALADSFETAFPEHEVVLNLASTALLARQIAEGAPADVFFSANVPWMDYLVAEDRVAPPMRYPLANRLVVVGPAGAAPMRSVEELADFGRVALADPESVPAGLYAREALSCAGLWTRVAPRVTPVLDVRAALLTVRSGAADAAVVYASDVQADPSVQVLYTWPEACHPEIRYAVAVLRAAPNPRGADALLRFATDPGRAALWARFGFVVQPEAAQAGGR